MINGVNWPVPTTIRLDSSGPFGLVILSLLVSAMSTVDYKRKIAMIVAVHEVRWWVTYLTLICTKVLVITLKDTFKY